MTSLNTLPTSLISLDYFTYFIGLLHWITSLDYFIGLLHSFHSAPPPVVSALPPAASCCPPYLLTSLDYFTDFAAILHLRRWITSLTSLDYLTYFIGWLHLFRWITSLTSLDHFIYFTVLVRFSPPLGPGLLHRLPLLTRHSPNATSHLTYCFSLVRTVYCMSVSPTFQTYDGEQAQS